MSDPKIQRSADYYQLMIDRYLNSGLAPRQAEVYQEIKQLVLECSTLEEIQERMKKEGYYEKPAQALYLDKMAAHAKAAAENGLEELAQIYRERYDEVAADYSKAFITGYEQRINKLLSKMSSVLGVFVDIFQSYLSWRGEDILTRNQGALAARIADKCQELDNYNTDFVATANHPYYRNHIPLNEQHYTTFIATIPRIINDGEDQEAQQMILNQAQQAWEIIKDSKKVIQEIGKAEEAKSKRSAWMVIPPSDKNGSYQFINNEQEG